MTFEAQFNSALIAKPCPESVGAQSGRYCRHVVQFPDFIQGSPRRDRKNDVLERSGEFRVTCSFEQRLGVIEVNLGETEERINMRKARDPAGSETGRFLNKLPEIKRCRGSVVLRSSVAAPEEGFYGFSLEQVSG